MDAIIKPWPKSGQNSNATEIVRPTREQAEEAVHQCMSIRGVKKPNVATITTQFTGIFKEDPAQQARFMMLATERGRG